MTRVFLPSSNSSESFVKILLGTNLLVVYVGYFFLFMLWTFLLVVIFEKFLPDTVNDPRFARVLDPVTLIIGFIYSIWLTSYIRGYSSSAEKYSSIILATQEYALRFFTFFSVIAKKNREEIKEHEQEVMDRLTMTRDLAIILISNSYKMFSPEEPDKVGGFRPNVLKVVQESKGDATRLVSACEISMYSLLIEESMEPRVSMASVHTLHQELCKIQTIRQEIVSSSRIVEPGIFQQIIFMSLMFYLFLWLPYSQWVSFGALATVFIYPTIVLILTIFVITREWLGNPFDKHRQINFMDFSEWRYSAYEKILEDFLKQIEFLRKSSIFSAELLDKEENFAKTSLSVTKQCILAPSSKQEQELIWARLARTIKPKDKQQKLAGSSYSVFGDSANLMSMMNPNFMGTTNGSYADAMNV